jgi:hypothetical protein
MRSFVAGLVLFVSACGGTSSPLPRPDAFVPRPDAPAPLPDAFVCLMATKPCVSAGDCCSHNCGPFVAGGSDYCLQNEPGGTCRSGLDCTTDQCSSQGVCECLVPQAACGSPQDCCGGADCQTTSASPGQPVCCVATGNSPPSSPADCCSQAVDTSGNCQ